LPQLRPKYAWIEKFSNRNIASQVQVSLPHLKTFFSRSWDKAMFHMENQDTG
jgi:hypothetical protein